MSDNEEENDIVAKRNKVFDAIGVAGRMHPEDRKELAALLGNKSLQRALHEILITADANAAILLGMDLVSPEGQLQAVRKQAEARAYSAVVESLVEFAFEEEETNNE